MNTFLYIIIFIIGITFGSFYTLAIHRIPRRQDIIHTHSYCPNCDHKLGFFELIPLLSYIALGGKCAHCKKRIHPRYFITELLSGLTFVLVALGINLNITGMDWTSLVYGAFCVLYITCIFLVAGIDKQDRKVEKGVIYYGIIISIVYIVYLYIVEQVSIYRYVMYLVIFLILLVIDNITLKKYVKNNYVIGILMLVGVMGAFTGELVTICTITITLLAIAIYVLINKIKNIRRKHIKEEKILNSELRIAFIMCVSNILVFIYALCNLTA